MSLIQFLICILSVATFCGCAESPRNLVVASFSGAMPYDRTERIVFIDSQRAAVLKQLGSELKPDIVVKRKDWKKQYQDYGQDMMRMASKAGLDADGLSKVLTVILEDGGQTNHLYLPIEAYASKWEGQPVWMVVLAWEFADSIAADVLEKHGKYPLTHHRQYAYAYTQTNLQQIYFTTCR